PFPRIPLTYAVVTTSRVASTSAALPCAACACCAAGGKGEASTSQKGAPIVFIAWNMRGLLRMEGRLWWSCEASDQPPPPTGRCATVETRTDRGSARAVRQPGRGVFARLGRSGSETSRCGAPRTHPLHHPPRGCRSRSAGASGASPLVRRIQPLPHPRERLARPTQRLEARRLQPEHTLRAAAPLAAAFRERRAHQPLRLEARERDVDRRDRHLAARALLQLPLDRRAVRVVAQPQHGQHDDLLELTQSGCLVHVLPIFDNVKIARADSFARGT